MSDAREVCLEQTVERLHESGLTATEISREMGVDEGWVRSLISFWNSEGDDA